jgi:hypothetical protein
MLDQFCPSPPVDEISFEDPRKMPRSSSTFPVTSNTPSVIILDSGAQISVSNNPDLVLDLHESTTTVTINGINKEGEPIRTNTIGHYPGLERIPVYFSKQVKRNILSFHDATKYYNVEWKPDAEMFIVNGDDTPLEFSKISNVFARDFSSHENNIVTVAENKTRFTAREIKSAEMAREVSKRLAYESDASLIQALKKGTINNMPITIRDIQKARAIFGPDIASLKGKATAKTPDFIERMEVNKLDEKSLSLYIDLIYIDKDCYFTSLSIPLNFFTCKYLGNRSDTSTAQTSGKSLSSLEQTLTSVITMYRGESFVIHSVMSDNEAVMLALKTTIGSLGACHVISGINTNHIAYLDRKIRLLKDRVR